MTRRTSARVEFIGQQSNIGRFFCPGSSDIKVDRTFPQILEDYKTVDEWTEACQKFDQAFETINTASACLARLDMVVRSILVIGVVVFFIINTLGSDWDNWGLFSILLLIIYIYAPFLLVIGVCLVLYMLCRSISKEIAWQKVKDSLRKSCGRESEINEAVSFYLRQEKPWMLGKYYIECILEIATNGNAIDEVESGMNLASIPVATVVNDSSVYTEAVVASDPVASAPVDVGPVDVGVSGSAMGNGMNTTSNRTSDDRLRDLENIASMLTEEEYDSSLQVV
eukprot:997840_1